MSHNRGRARRAARIALTLGLLAAAATPALTHDFFLIPARSQAAPGETIEVAMHVSDVFPGPPTAWRAERVDEFFLLDASGRIDLKPPAIAGEPAAARIALRSEGTSIIALVTTPSQITLKAKDFEGYLRHEGHEEILQARASSKAAGKKERERYTRYVKTLVRAGEPSSAALTELGLPIEIVPEAQPETLSPGESLPVRVLFQGEPYGGGYLCATYAGHSREHDAYAWCGRLDGRGRAVVPITAPGWQLLRITRMRPAPGDGRTGWESFWAALTFEVAAPPAGR
jgi:hypothetical protein